METKYLNLSAGVLFLIFALILFIRHSPNKRSNIFLGVLFLLIAGYTELIHFHFHSVHTNDFHHLSNYLPLDALLLMLMSPCLYFYVLLLLNRPLNLIRWSTLAHGLPLLPCIIFNVLFYFRPVDERVNWLIHNFYYGALEMTLISALLYLQISFYLFISYKAIRKQLKISVHVEKNGYRINISWVSLFLFINIVFVVVSMPVCFWINNEQTNITIGNAAMNLDFIYLFIMTVLKKGMMDMEKIEEKKVSYQVNEELALSYWKTLTDYMAKMKPYLDKDCSLGTVAKDTNISETQLSNILHAHGGIPFADFINGYRLKKAEILLKDKSKYRKNMETIAFDCGFGSRSAFYRAFARAYNTSPKAYRKLHDKNREA